MVGQGHYVVPATIVIDSKGYNMMFQKYTEALLIYN